MGDFTFHVIVGVKNDAISQDAGRADLAEILRERVEKAIMDLSWVTDMMITEE